MLGLSEVCKMLNEDNIGEVTRENLMEEKAQIIETIDEHRNKKVKQHIYILLNI